jgi:flagellar biosynthesis/type III secretory pathway protein FliH
MSSMPTQRFRSVTASLPQFSLAALLIALAFTAMVSTMVGIVAWSVKSQAPGIAQTQLQAAEKAAFDRGRLGGYKLGLAKGTDAGRRAGALAGVKKGYRAGLLRGVKRGYERGKAAGYSEGYAAGVAAATPARKPSTKKR